LWNYLLSAQAFQFFLGQFQPLSNQKTLIDVYEKAGKYTCF
jgi:hypothetical protein